MQCGFLLARTVATPAASRYSPRSAARPAALKAKQQLRQLRHVDRNPPRLILAEQLGG